MSNTGQFLNQENIIKKVFDETTNSLRISGSAGGGTSNSASALVTEAHDYVEITYVGITTNINTTVYKLGGAAGTVVATLTMAYDGSNRLTSVTRS